MKILEAGCGLKWGLDLTGVRYSITGVDINQDALKIRKNQRKDLDIAILGDLRTVALGKEEYDVIYNSCVLEHIESAENVLKNFICWLKPGGLLIIRIPDRNSTKGFLTRISPFWIHVFYKKYFQGLIDAGKPGHDPFPTVFDKIVSRNGIYDFCEHNNLKIKGEYVYEPQYSKYHFLEILINLLLKMIHFASIGMLSKTNGDLLYFIEKS